MSMPWHAPFVRRAALPRSTATKLAGFVADSLLSVLMKRDDLPAETQNAVSQVVRKRIAAGETLRAVDDAARVEVDEGLPELAGLNPPAVDLSDLRSIAEIEFIMTAQDELTATALTKRACQRRTHHTAMTSDKDTFLSGLTHDRHRP